MKYSVSLDVCVGAEVQSTVRIMTSAASEVCVGQQSRVMCVVWLLHLQEHNREDKSEKQGEM